MIGRLVIPIAIACSSLVLAPPAGAQPTDQATQDAARTLGRAGLDLFDKGDLAGALAKFEQAYSLYKAPTLGLLSARCLTRMGRLREASERYREVVGLNLGASPPAAFLEAKKSAEEEGAALLVRVPKISVVIEGASPADVTVSIDGRPIAKEALSEPQLVDPGAHRVEGKKGDQAHVAEVTVAESEAGRAVLRFEQEPAPLNPQAKPIAAAPPSTGIFRTAGFISIGVGASGLITGAVLTGLIASKKSYLDGDGGCVDARCPPKAKADVDAYNGLRIGSTVGYVAGIAFAGAGVALVLFGPRASAEPAPRGGSGQGAGPRAELSVGLSSMTLKGVF